MNRVHRLVLLALPLTAILALAPGCEQNMVTNAARQSLASFLTTIVNGAINSTVGVN